MEFLRNKKIQNMIILLTIALAIVFGVLYFHKDLSESIENVLSGKTKTKQEIELIKVQKDKLNQKIKELKDFNEYYPTKDIEQVRFSTLIYVKELIEGLEVEAIETDKDIKSEHGISQVPVTVQVLGSFKEIKELTEKAQDREKNIFIRNILVEFVKEEEKNTKLDCTIDIIALAKEESNMKNTLDLSSASNSDPFGKIVDLEEVRKRMEEMQKKLVTGEEDISSLTDMENNNSSNESNTNEVTEIGFFPLENRTRKANIIRGPKTGINLVVEKETEVIAVEKGNVIYAGRLNERGITVMVKAENGNVSIYSELSLPLVNVGDNVRNEQPIAVAGSELNYFNLSYVVNNIAVDIDNYINKDMLTE